MKKLILLALAIGPTNIFGQTPTNKTNDVSKLHERIPNDTSVYTLITIGPGKQARKTAYFLNDRFIKHSLLVSTNPELMESLKVIYKPVEIDSVKYDRQIHLVAKNNYFPKAISLPNLIAKYYPLNYKTDSLIFMIDGNIIHGDYNTYEIDENNLLSVTWDGQNEGDKIKLHFVKLTTRSEENIKNFKKGNIWMRGDGVTLTK
ncbi:hypothetical protein [Niabella hibiscisoli]|uniref:hypothetical protein n=1 Tax=Niabella hibiscisoli TaxID=1825928 RepID=UPI001F0F5ECB|nr:hypothetical protein [Niabella hibiscisoli]MCH5715577.1 hypothetical protein [Niabella hibiscisoli]